MEIKRSGSQPSNKGPVDWFTGTVRIDPLFQPIVPARAVGASVTFEPGARTAWHTHPLGQTLIVTAGCGLAQREGGPIEQIHPGDVILFAPGEKHWHGAAATTAAARTSPSRNNSTGKPWIGWKKSATNNTTLDRKQDFTRDLVITASLHPVEIYTFWLVGRLKLFQFCIRITEQRKHFLGISLTQLPVACRIKMQMIWRYRCATGRRNDV